MIRGGVRDHMIRGGAGLHDNGLGWNHIIGGGVGDHMIVSITGNAGTAIEHSGVATSSKAAHGGDHQCGSHSGQL